MGKINLEDFNEKIEKYNHEIACAMITYPSTFGVFQDSITYLCDEVHRVGGKVYLDGANMNA